MRPLFGASVLVANPRWAVRSLPHGSVGSAGLRLLPPLRVHPIPARARAFLFRLHQFRSVATGTADLAWACASCCASPPLLGCPEG